MEENLEAFLGEGGGDCCGETAVVGLKFSYPFVLNADAPVNVFEIHKPRIDVTEHCNQIFLADALIAFEPKGDGSGEDPWKELLGGRPLVAKSICEIIERVE